MSENRLSFGADDALYNFTSQSQSEEDIVKHTKKSDKRPVENAMLSEDEDEDSDNGFDLMSFEAKPKGKISSFISR